MIHFGQAGVRHHRQLWGAWGFAMVLAAAPAMAIDGPVSIPQPLSPAPAGQPSVPPAPRPEATYLFYSQAALQRQLARPGRCAIPLPQDCTGWRVLGVMDSGQLLRTGKDSTWWRAQLGDGTVLPGFWFNAGGGVPPATAFAVTATAACGGEEGEARQLTLLEMTCRGNTLACATRWGKNGRRGKAFLGALNRILLTSPDTRERIVILVRPAQFMAKEARRGYSDDGIYRFPFTLPEEIEGLFGGDLERVTVAGADNSTSERWLERAARGNGYELCIAMKAKTAIETLVTRQMYIRQEALSILKALDEQERQRRLGGTWRADADILDKDKWREMNKDQKVVLREACRAYTPPTVWLALAGAAEGANGFVGLTLVWEKDEGK
jgi:hypothetical protein